MHVLVFYPLLNWKMHGETMKFVNVTSFGIQFMAFQWVWYFCDYFSVQKLQNEQKFYKNVLYSVLFLVCWGEWEGSEAVLPTGKEFSTVCHILWWTGCTLSEEIRFWRGTVVLASLRNGEHPLISFLNVWGLEL